MEFDSLRQQAVVYSLGNFVSGQRDRYKNGGAMARFELIKITTDGTSTVAIANASYILQYVHRDVAKDYFILPAPSFEKDTTGFIKQESARTMFKTFLDDSRALFNKYNKNVYERKVLEAVKDDE
jgi:poly-gamma-glutamate synthesis protein (capsule biosynthesis protein)